MLLAKPLPLFPYEVPVENMDTGEMRVFTVESPCLLDARVTGCQHAFRTLGWHRTRGLEASAIQTH